MSREVELRPLGGSELQVTPIALGCWPMAGVTTLDATHENGLATVRAALDAGVNHFDTAYVYGPNGESDRILAEALEGRREEIILASKVGVHYEQTTDAGKPSMATCGRPEVLRCECDELLRRLRTDRVDLLYLHSPDPETPIAESAGALAELMQAGKTRAVGVSNTQLEQTQAFAKVCPIAAIQLPFNMLQRGIQQRTAPWAQENGVSVVTYWPLMKGLLAGRMDRNHRLAEADSRRKYPMYQGQEWQRNQDFLDALREAATQADLSVAQLVVAWTMSQPGVTSVLCGAKRPDQILETAAAMRYALSDETRAQVERAIQERGDAETNRAFT